MWLLCAALPASALVSGIYNYEISNNKAVITGLTAEGANATTLNIPGHIIFMEKKLQGKGKSGIFAPLL